MATARGTPLVEAPGGLLVNRVRLGAVGVVADIVTPGRDLPGLNIGLHGRPAAWNAALAIAASDALVDRAGARRLSDDALRTCLEGVHLPGRFDVCSGDPTIVLDVAHTPDSVAALVESLGAAFPGRPTVVVLGALIDKDLEGILNHLAPIARQVVASPCGSPREVPPAQIVRACVDKGMTASAASDPGAALERARSEAAPDAAVVLVCGSVYLVGAVMKAAGWSPARPVGPRQLSHGS
jgi:dihydrofolate synthase/folylpolyglutamate synthase